MSPDLLLLTTYPIVTPHHGGQVRAKALATAYEAGGFKVTTLAVVEKGAWQRQELGPRDVEFPVDDPRWFLEGRDIPLTADIRSGIFATESSRHLQQIIAALPDRLSAIHLEQPYLLPLARRILQERRHEKAVLIYGSANIEAPLREAIFRQLEIEDSAGVVDRILALEQEACRVADITLAVAPFDHETLTQWGARRVMRAANGIDQWEASPQASARWADKLKHLRRFALFVASAHPPNFDGFFRAFGDSLGFVPPDCRIVVAGSVGSHILEHYGRQQFNTLNLSRLEVTGVLPSDDLAALKSLCSAFLLPIFEGGGSNIKTAEAIYSGKRVLATTVSLRGFEMRAELPEILVADTRDEWREGVRRLLSPGPEFPPPSASGRAVRERLLWKNCLAAVAPAIHQLIKER